MFAAVCVVFVCLFCAMMESSTVEVPKFLLNNGRQIPAIALGTYLGVDQIFPQNATTPKPAITKQCDLINKAIDLGYRHFDTASIYETEADIGEAVRRKIAEGVVSRADIFITTKLWNTHHRRNEVIVALRNSLRELNLNYVDAFLMHWPMALNKDYTFADVDYMETWRGMEDAVNLGLARSIGVSNFNIQQLRRVLEEGTIKPAILQIEIHFQLIQTELVDFAQSEGIVVMGYSPFGALVPREGVYYPGPRMDDPVLSSIASKYNKTVPQIALRWQIERHLIPMPKTVKVKRLKENIDIFDFTLTSEEMEQLSELDTETRYTFPSFWQNHPHYPFEKVLRPLLNPFHHP